MHPRTQRSQRYRALESCQRLLEITELLLNEAEGQIRRGEMRIELDRVVALFERGTEVAPVVVDHTYVSRDDGRDGVQRLCDRQLLQGIVKASHRHQARHAVPMMRGRISRIEGDGALKLALGRSPIPVLRGLHVGERRPRL